ncbi:hypothetical protein HELRODRAFT_193567 [Helobdella robusta]|uniref:MRH domain-containing protein n=1 Tax=Helobdella robusta TaxID=6412 RepID=T1FV48_HELRO|nr:hypothetical protein HELRODRAFT_193567 [Helobdella robusta]ESN95359.1 hypothetical protein HELRODRAFT_193567 [Helobdella robusta]
MEWQSLVACSSKSKYSNLTASKCYLYDNLGSLVNLNSLVGDIYEVSRDNDDDDDDDDDGLLDNKDIRFKFSVCRNMMEGSSCSGSSACLLFPNGTFFSLGKIASKPSSQLLSSSSSSSLEMNDNNEIYIEYVDNDSMMPDCKGSQPLLTSAINCTYLIEWMTEYACSDLSISVHSSCILSSLPDDDVDDDEYLKRRINIDLSGLTADTPYNITARDNAGKVYSYILNICTNKTMHCYGDAMTSTSTGNNQPAACQLSRDGQIKKSIGSFQQQELQYSDGKIVMVMGGGDMCASAFQRTTIIQFECNTTVGKGAPEFLHEDECTYMFTWKTSLACLQQQQQQHMLSSCTIKINNDNKTSTFDLSRLMRGLLQNKDNRYVSLGSYMQQPYFDDVSKAVVIRYVGGDACIATNNHNNDTSHDATNNTQRRLHSTMIFFHCLPGNDQTEPTLLNGTLDGCEVFVSWHTSVACPLTHLLGEDCSIKDPLTGLNFDLNPLKKLPTSPTGFYKAVTRGGSYSVEHEYFINVCGPVHSTVCNVRNASYSGLKPNAGVCQVSKFYRDKQVHNTGQWSSQLHYSDGRLKLTYRNGDDYRSNPPVPRHTDIEFVCDHQSGLDTSPIFVEETQRTYKFIWMTSLACSSGSTGQQGGAGLNTCALLNGGDGARYDLSSLTRYESNWMKVATLNGRLVKLIFNVCRSVLIGWETASCDPSSSACLIFLDKNETVSLGKSISHPIMNKDKQLTLNYDLGDRCKEDNKLRYSLSIKFFCKQLATMPDIQHVTMGDDDDGCAYNIHWITSTACPINDSSSGSSVDDSCRFNDIINDHVYNFNDFREKVYEINVGGRLYKVALCGSLKICKDDVAAVLCASDGQVVARMNERSIKVNSDGLPEIQFSSSKINISVQVSCDKNLLLITNMSLTFVKNIPYWSVFSIRHASFCFKKLISCQTYDDLGFKYDLDPLYKDAVGYTAGNERGDRVEFNVCGSLGDGSSATLNNNNCSRPGVGACAHKVGSDVTSSIDAGHVMSSPSLDNSSGSSVTLTYTGGDQCGSGRRSSRVKFICSTTQSDPVLLTNNIEECDLLIEWKTPHACPFKSVTGSNCMVTHPSYPLFTFNLTLLKLYPKDYELDFDGGEVFLMHVCSPVNNTACNSMKAGACIVHGSGGSEPAAPVDSMGVYNEDLVYNDGKLTLTYTYSSPSSSSASSLSKCKGNRTTTIDFVCELGNIGLTSGPMYLGGNCNRRFEWVTSLACFDQPSTKTKTTTTTTTTKSPAIAPTSISTPNTRPLPTETGQREKGESNNSSSIVGAFVGLSIIIISVVFIIVAVLIYRKRYSIRRRFGRSYEHVREQDYQYSRLSEREPVLLHNVTYDDVTRDVTHGGNNVNGTSGRDDDLFSNLLSDDDDDLLL